MGAGTHRGSNLSTAATAGEKALDLLIPQVFVFIQPLNEPLASTKHKQLINHWSNYKVTWIMIMN